MTVLQTEPEALSGQKRTEQPAPIKRVCFVCTGNTCRSPMAAAVANALAAEPLQKLPQSVRNLTSPELEAFSAGLAAREGDPIAPNAVLALEAAGVCTFPPHDFHTHTAHTLCAEEAERYDLLIGLTREHALALLMRFPHLAQRIAPLPEEISDPYGGDEALYRDCLMRITRAVRTMLFPGSAGEAGGTVS